MSQQHFDPPAKQGSNCVHPIWCCHNRVHTSCCIAYCNMLAKAKGSLQSAVQHCQASRHATSRTSATFKPWQLSKAYRPLRLDLVREAVQPACLLPMQCYKAECQCHSTGKAGKQEFAPCTSLQGRLSICCSISKPGSCARFNAARQIAFLPCFTQITILQAVLSDIHALEVVTSLTSYKLWSCLELKRWW